jgi:predicted nucleotidyltransferase
MSDLEPARIEHFLASFVERHRAALGDVLVGIYSYGSLSLGDFDPASSDLDLLVITKDQLTDAQIGILRQFYADLSKEWNDFSGRIEAAYIPRAEAVRHTPGEKHYLISPVWDFQPAELGNDWVLNRSIARSGKPLFGPEPSTIIDNVPRDEISRVEKKLLCDVWAKHIDGPAWMKPRKYQAFTILTVCRILYGIEHGVIVSKPAAAAWAIETFPQWNAVITSALTTRHDAAEGPLNDVIGFLKFAVGKQCPT